MSGKDPIPVVVRHVKEVNRIYRLIAKERERFGRLWADHDKRLAELFKMAEELKKKGKAG